MLLSLSDGQAAVAMAREALESQVKRRPPPARRDSDLFSETRGAFVTLNLTDPSGERLRGCIGFPYPTKKLGDAIREAAKAAASEDPRFPPVRPDELDSIVVEVSILTPPQDLEATRREDLPSKVRIGVDGLIISDKRTSGLLLPQVATDFGMDQLEFLSQACMKAGLPPDSWLDVQTRVQVFQADIFAESGPKDGIIRVNPRAS
jgi:uncharacterized protein (TIGR00296 family)